MHAFIQKGIKQREEMVEDVLAARGITFWGSDDWDVEFKREMRFHIGDPPGAVLPNPAMKERLRAEGISDKLRDTIKLAIQNVIGTRRGQSRPTAASANEQLKVILADVVTPAAGGAVGEHGRFPTADALAAHVKVQVEGWYAAFLTRAS